VFHIKGKNTTSLFADKPARYKEFLPEAALLICVIYIVFNGGQVVPGPPFAISVPAEKG